MISHYFFRKLPDNGLSKMLLTPFQACLSPTHWTTAQGQPTLELPQMARHLQALQPEGLMDWSQLSPPEQLHLHLGTITHLAQP